MPFIQFVTQYKNCSHCCHSLHGNYSESNTFCLFLQVGLWSSLQQQDLALCRQDMKENKRFLIIVLVNSSRWAGRYNTAIVLLSRATKKQTAVCVCANLNILTSLANPSQRKSQNIYSEMLQNIINKFLQNGGVIIICNINTNYKLTCKRNAFISFRHPW